MTPLVRVFGRVVDYKTNEGVSNARIAFFITGFNATADTVVADETGFYAVSLPRGTYNPRINGPDVDSNAGTIMPVGTHYLADYFVNGGDCVVFYGTVRDATTGERLAGATISFIGTRQSEADGSYVFELGCPTRTPNGFPPFGTGTVFMTVAKPGYVTRQPYGNRREFLSRLQRIDVALEPGS